MKTIVKVVVGVLLVVTLYTAWQVVDDASPKYGALWILTTPTGADVFSDGIYEGTYRYYKERGICRETDWRYGYYNSGEIWISHS